MSLVYQLPLSSDYKLAASSLTTKIASSNSNKPDLNLNLSNLFPDSSSWLLPLTTMGSFSEWVTHSSTSLPSSTRIFSPSKITFRSLFFQMFLFFNVFVSQSSSTFESRLVVCLKLNLPRVRYFAAFRSSFSDLCFLMLS